MLCAKDIENISCRRKLVISGVKKTKVCLNLELLLGKEFTVDDLPSNILYRNCADTNDKLVEKINAVHSQQALFETDSCSNIPNSNVVIWLMA